MMMHNPECSISVIQMVCRVISIKKYEWHYCGIRQSFIPISTMGSWNCQLYKKAYCSQDVPNWKRSGNSPLLRILTAYCWQFLIFQISIAAGQHWWGSPDLHSSTRTDISGYRPGLHQRVQGKWGHHFKQSLLRASHVRDGHFVNAVSTSFDHFPSLSMCQIFWLPNWSNVSL